MWAPATKNDVYLAARGLAGEQKFSLHESGDWRQQFLTPEKAEKYGHDQRIVDQWEQPAEEGDSRLTLGFTVRIRSQDMADYPERKPAKDVIWLPAAPEGKAAVVHVVISRVQDLAVNLGQMIPFAGFSLVDGRAALLFLQFQDIPAASNDQVDALIREVASKIDFDVMTTPRMLLHGNNEHGRFVWDVALRPDQRPV
jgi:hypothetical protein